MTHVLTLRSVSADTLTMNTYTLIVEYFMTDSGVAGIVTRNFTGTEAQSVKALEELAARTAARCNAAVDTFTKEQK